MTKSPPEAARALIDASHDLLPDQLRLGELEAALDVYDRAQDEPKRFSMNASNEEMRAAAEAATPGPWETNGTQVNIVDEERRRAEERLAHFYVAQTSTDTRDPRNAAVQRADARFIALANPSTILAMLDREAALLTERDALRAALLELLGACHEDAGVPDSGDEDDEPVGWSDQRSMALTFGMMRRAAAALNPNPASEG
jgi:hypothetical protein